MMNLDKIYNVYFVGIGGIGMSAIARYFLSKDANVAGYDRVETTLTKALENEGCIIHYNDGINEIPKSHNHRDTLVIYTPAIPSTNEELNYFKSNEFEVVKRSEVLGLITKGSFTIGVAGTHGKTTTSTIVAHLLDQADYKCDAFLGGISANFNSNFVFSNQSKATVIEADEYDRSFLTLSPNIAIVTSTDADHLDIYAEHSSLLTSFQDYVNKLPEDGLLILKKGLGLQFKNTITYSATEEADVCLKNLKIENSVYCFDVQTPNELVKDVVVGLPGLHNVENALAAFAVGLELGVSIEAIKEGLASFKGVKRRFEYQVKTKDLVYIDDYAHHPTELKACIESVRTMFPNKRITGIFQPHLYSRTRDFANEFSESLSLLDDLYLLDIYPARELPIEGVTSEMLLEKINLEHKEVVTKEELLNKLNIKDIEVLLTLGAGDIDTLVQPLKDKIVLGLNSLSLKSK
jgi:UDP-N-acetylmuramate--alanine ligase